MNLIGEKCSLRAIEPADVDFLFKWENDTDHWLVSGTIAPFSRQDLVNYIGGIRDIYTDKQLRLMISIEGRPAGLIDLYDFDPNHQRAGIGVLIGEKSDRRLGVASEALRLLIDYSFEILHLHQLHASIPATNTASLTLFENSGFQKIGIRKEWLKTQSGWIDEHLYQLINRKS